MFESLPTTDKHWIYDLVFLQIPKTASSSINHVLKKRNLVEKHKALVDSKFARHPLYKGVFDTRHCLPSHLKMVFSDKIRGYFSFAVVREPISRLQSSYHFGRENKLWKIYGLSEDTSADAYIEFLWKNRTRQDILILLPQSQWTHSDVFRPTEILRFEELSESWGKMLDKHNIQGISKTLPRLNKSNNTGEQIFSAESLDKIKILYRVDYELLKYDI